MSTHDDRVRIPLNVFMKDGRELVGNLLANMGGTLDRTLNNESLFVAFETEDGERLIAKDAILEVEKRQVTKKGELPGLNQGSNTSPHRTLGVSASASDDEITAAFMNLVQIYRPDQFENVTLPAEVQDYINSKYRSVYEAHQSLMEGKTASLSHQAAAE